MSKKRILIFIDWFLPGFKAGGPVQSCVNLIDNLKDEFDFWIITRDTDYCENEPYLNITSDTWSNVEEQYNVYYFSRRNLTYKALTAAAKAAQPDIVFINGIYSWYFSVIPLLIVRRLKGVKVLVSARGMLAPSAINVKGNKKKLFLILAKLIRLYQGVIFHTTNSAEAEHVRVALGTKQRVKIAPNLPKRYNAQSFQTLVKTKGILYLASIARVSPEKNTKFALRVLSEYRYKGQIVLDFYGPIYNEPYWKECLEIISSLPENIKVSYKGSIDNSLVNEVLKQYHALFLPTLGENFGHIIVESLAAGRPVLISDQTPWRSLKGQNIGYDLSLDRPSDFAECIQGFLDQSQDEYDKLANAAYLYAQQVSQDNLALEQNRLLFR